MKTMKCIECCLKHLAAALSYGKEIIAGHDASNDLDHRIDMLGELVNLLHHLFLIDNVLYNLTILFRRFLQNKHIQVNLADLLKIRLLYKKVLELDALTNKNEISIKLDKNFRNNTSYKIIFDDVKNILYFNLSYLLIKLNILNLTKIYVVSDLNLLNFDVIKVKSLKDFVLSLNENELFIYMKENYFITKSFDFNLLPDIYLQEKALNYHDSKYFPYKWNSGAPHIMKRLLFLNTYNLEKDILTNYFISNNIEPKYVSYNYVITLKDKLCCSNKNRINQINFVTTLSEKGFQDLLLWYNK